MTHTSEFLGFTIHNSGNSDGYVLRKDGPDAPLWMCNLGNYNTLESAQESALFYYMMERPEEFHACIWFRTHRGNGMFHEYYRLKNVLDEERREMPPEITCSRGMGGTILFNEHDWYIYPPKRLYNYVEHADEVIGWLKEELEQVENMVDFNARMKQDKNATRQVYNVNRRFGLKELLDKITKTIE